jgi:hypothetical protein
MPSLLDSFGSTDSLIKGIGGGLLKFNQIKDDLAAKAVANKNQHPLYSNLGPQGLMAETRQDVLFGGPGGQAHSDQGRAAMILQQDMQEAEKRKQQEAQLQEIQVQAQRKQMVDMTAAKAAQEAAASILPEGPQLTTTLADIETARKESQKAKMEVEHQAKVAEGAEAMLKAGASEKDLEGWAKFTDEFDLTTIGIALLASNDGSGNIVSNLGQALMLGRQAAEFRKDKIAAGEAAARKENREIAKDNASIADTASKISKRESDAEVAKAGAFTAREKNDITIWKTQVNAATRLAAAKISAADKAGYGIKPTDKPSEAQAAIEIERYLPGVDKALVEQYAPIIGQLVATDKAAAAKAGAKWTPAMTVAPFLEQLKASGDIVEDEGFLGFGDGWELP